MDLDPEDFGFGDEDRGGLPSAGLSVRAPTTHKHRLPVADPDDPDSDHIRFDALAYRLVRAVLAMRGLLASGQSIWEADQSRPPGTPALLEQRVLAHLDGYKGAPVSAPLDLSLVQPGETKALSDLLIYTALRMRVPPRDPILHWLQPECLEDVWPTPEDILSFEDALTHDLARGLHAGSRQGALAVAEEVLGPIGQAERGDFVSLAFSRLREAAAVTTEDDRALMVSRLDSVAVRAKGALDLRAELAALRALGSIQGLTHADLGKSEREILLLLSSRQRKGNAISSEGPPAHTLGHTA